jgi:hypothetical protein
MQQPTDSPPNFPALIEALTAHAAMLYLWGANRETITFRALGQSIGAEHWGRALGQSIGAEHWGRERDLSGFTAHSAGCGDCPQRTARNGINIHRRQPT